MIFSLCAESTQNQPVSIYSDVLSSLRKEQSSKIPYFKKTIIKGEPHREFWTHQIRSIDLFAKMEGKKKHSFQMANEPKYTVLAESCRDFVLGWRNKKGLRKQKLYQTYKSLVL